MKSERKSISSPDLLYLILYLSFLNLFLKGLMTDRSDNRSERNDYYENDSDYYPQKGHNARGSYSESQSDSEYHWNDKQNRNRYNENNHSHHNGDGNGREIENIEEGNEDGEDEDEEGEFDDNTTHKSVDQKPAMSMASMSPFYHQRKTSVFDFANKQDKEFDNPMSNFSQRSSVTSATFAPHLQPFSSNSSVTAGTQPQQFQQPSSNSKFDNSNSSKSGYSDQKSVNDAFNSPPDSPEQPVVVRAGKSNANKPAGDRETGFTPKTFSPKGLSPASENVLPPVSDSSSGIISLYTISFNY